MRYRLLVGVLAVLLGTAGLSSYGQAQDLPAKGPNVIVVMTDDMRLDDLAYMPNTLRLLADRGATFAQMISPYPLCCPARAELLTGQFSHNNGVQGNAWPRGGYYRLDNSNTLPVWLQASGYETAFMGKYLNQYGDRDPHEVPPGWDDWNGSVKHIYNYDNLLANENGNLVSYRGIYQTDLFDQAEQQMVHDFAQSDRPFFLWMSYIAPHAECSTRGVPRSIRRGCWHAPEPAVADRGTFNRLPPLHNPAINEKDMSDKGAFMRRLPLLSQHKMAVEDADRIARIQSLQSVDRAIAHLVATLRRTGEYKNTYIIFTSDNGIQLGEHRWRFKVLGYEPSVRVPLLIAGPGIPAGVVRHQQVSTVDLTATIADMTGTTPGLRQDGESLLPLATGHQPDGRNRVLPLEAGPLNNTSPGWLYRGVRTDRYTLLRWRNGDVELYDRRSDPYEVASVAGEQRYAGVQERLTRLLDRLETCVGSQCLAYLGPPQSTG